MQSSNHNVEQLLESSHRSASDTKHSSRFKTETVPNTDNEDHIDEAVPLTVQLSSSSTKQSKKIKDNNKSQVQSILDMFIKNRTTYNIALVAIGVLTIVGITVLAIGVYRYSSKNDGCDNEVNIPSRERLKLENILNEAKNDYYTIYPNEIYADPGLDLVEIVDKYIPYDPSWRTLKSRTDHALKLRKKLKDLNIEQSYLRPREKKAYAQLDHYLGSIFGNPYDENYYAGDWMLGPNYFCWQQICYAPHSLGYHFDADHGFIPTSALDVQKIIKIIKKMKTTYRVYTENMVRGVKTGMIRSVEDCASGLDAFSGKFKNIVREGAKGTIIFLLFSFSETKSYKVFSLNFLESYIWTSSPSSNFLHYVAKSSIFPFKKDRFLSSLPFKLPN